MRLQVIGHASLRVNAGGKELLCDPWTLGSCYWRSWWNYPPVSDTLRESLAPDFIYLTHLHWDHYHGPSLRKFPKETRIYVPYFRYDRMVRDLSGMGFNNVNEIRHGARIKLADGLSIRSYQIGPIFSDSALVIEAEDQIILNANDGKFAGLPLRQILTDYPRIDFCLRSHSSANARRCMHITDEPDAPLDDDTHYLESFSLFMKRVRPRFAIPFASNTCFLHKDTVAMNAFSQTPSMVSGYFEAFARRENISTVLRVMISGDEWTTDGGFSLAPNDWFEARERRLREYAEDVQPALQKYYLKEDKTRVPLKLVQEFFAELWRNTPWILKRRFDDEKVLIVSSNSQMRDYFELNLRSGVVTCVPAESAADYAIRTEFPSVILNQSLRMNMFSQAWISKRVHYYSPRSKMPVLQNFLRILEFSEAELLPLRNLLSMRTLRALLPRWREPLLYAHALYYLFRGKNYLQIEARLLAV
jgi:UDP-MurNAc hydroxylase